MSEFSITSPDFEEGKEIPKKFGYKHGNEQPDIGIGHIPNWSWWHNRTATWRLSHSTFLKYFR